MLLCYRSVAKELGVNTAAAYAKDALLTARYHSAEQRLSSNNRSTGVAAMTCTPFNSYPHESELTKIDNSYGFPAP